MYLMCFDIEPNSP